MEVLLLELMRLITAILLASNMAEVGGFVGLARLWSLDEVLFNIVLLLISVALKSPWILVSFKDLSELLQDVGVSKTGVDLVLHGSWEVVCTRGNHMRLKDSMVAYSCMDSSLSPKVLHDGKDGRGLLFQDDLVMVDNCAVSVNEGSHDAILIHVSDGISLLKDVLVGSGDQTVDTQIVIHSLVDGG